MDGGRREKAGNCGLQGCSVGRFRDQVLGPVSGERPLRATSHLLFSKRSFS